jgi:uncharacterized protein (TIGR03437 family)
MRRFLAVALSVLGFMAPAFPRRIAGECGTTRETAAESFFIHRQRARGRSARPLAARPFVPSASHDIGDIAIVTDANGVVDRLNQFDLDGDTLLFTPVATGAAQYAYSVNPQGYDSAAAANGIPLAALDDDDTRQVALPFPFQFFGVAYTSVYVNSDGNLTFNSGDDASSERSLGRMTTGPPRIAPLFDDLNPAQTAGGVRVLSDTSRVVVSWVAVPEYSDAGTGIKQTFQVALYADGRIAFSYSGVTPTSAVVGIAPGTLQGATSIVDFLSDPSATYSAAVAEVFGNLATVDVVAVAQQFYQTHEDAYDYLAIYNAMDIPALGEGTVAYEQTIRNSGTGFGVPMLDYGSQFGSASRLQSVLNLGPLSQYPADPSALVPARAPQHDTPLTILAHETGHRFLAFASVRDPADSTALPMLGFQNAHWSFLFNSEASVLEGERIADSGPGASPEFRTTDLAQAYAPLDQYLMGFRAAGEVPDSFLVQNPSPAFQAAQHPFTGVSFNGTRRNISAASLIQAEGRRTPDQSVAQRHFHMAFILVVAAGTQPAAADLAKIDTFRRQFESFYAQAASSRAAMETTLQHSMQLSLYPAAGIAQGTTAAASLTVATPPAADLAVQFVTPNGNARLPASVKVPAGAAGVTFQIAGVNPGVEDVQAVPSDPSYETAYARVQVADASSIQLTAQIVAAPAAGRTGVAVRVTDINGLPYAGAGILATPSADGGVVPSEAFTDSQGQAVFQWNTSSHTINQLRLTLDGMPSVTATVSAGTGVPFLTEVVNAASLKAPVAPGSLSAVIGGNLGGASLSMNGAPLPAIAAGDDEIEFYLPDNTPLGTATFTVSAAAGLQASTTGSIVATAPGIFPQGVVVNGRALVVYCTGLGPTAAAGSLQTTVLTPTVFVGATPVTPFFSGLAPGFRGLYQVNAIIPASVPSGLQSLILSVDNTQSNQITIAVP